MRVTDRAVVPMNELAVALLVAACARPAPAPAQPPPAIAAPPPDATAFWRPTDAAVWRPPQPYVVILTFDTPDAPADGLVENASGYGDTPAHACADAKDEAFADLHARCNGAVAAVTGIADSCTCIVTPQFDIRPDAGVTPTLDVTCRTSVGGTCAEKDDSTRGALGTGRALSRERAEIGAIDDVRWGCNGAGLVGARFGSTCACTDDGCVCVANGSCE